MSPVKSNWLGHTHKNTTGTQGPAVFIILRGILQVYPAGGVVIAGVVSLF